MRKIKSFSFIFHDIINKVIKNGRLTNFHELIIFEKKSMAEFEGQTVALEFKF